MESGMSSAVVPVQPESPSGDPIPFEPERAIADWPKVMLA